MGGLPFFLPKVSSLLKVPKPCFCYHTISSPHLSASTCKGSTLPEPGEGAPMHMTSLQLKPSGFPWMTTSFSYILYCLKPVFVLFLNWGCILLIKLFGASSIHVHLFLCSKFVLLSKYITYIVKYTQK